MLKFRGRYLAVAGGLVMVAIAAIALTASILDGNEPERRRTSLQDLSEEDLDRIVVQLQDPRYDRLSPSVVDDYRDGEVLAGEDGPRSREPLVVLRSDEGDGSLWENELLASGVGVGFLAALFLVWRTLRLRKERRQ